jgi:HEAT repeats
MSDSGHQALPNEVSTAVPGWTALELLQAVKPLYPFAENITSANKFISLMHDRVRRVSNPEFESRFSGDPDKAAEFFFDRTDGLLYTANQWGGPECKLQAMLASHELGCLRDPRFVFPALDAESFETRIAAVACLAFLWSAEGNDRLKRMVNDPDPGVRQSALWAYGFAGGEGAREMLIDKSRNDPNNRVQEFASQALEADDGSWWKM